MKKCILLLLFTGIAGTWAMPSEAQLLKKLKEKAEKKILGETDKKPSTEESNSGDNNPVGGGNNSGGGRPTNKGGGGLTNTTPPDVLQQITDAETAHAAGNFSDARYSIQQALIGVEIQLGRELLKALPDKILDMPEDTLQDKVVSNQWGWSNLTIQRVYYDGKERQMSMSIGNNSFYSGWVNLYFGGTYTQAGANDQNVKQVRVKNYKALIQYDDSKGYTLIVPLGQSSMIVWDCINFKDENEVLKAASLFDIDDIKRRMGEQ